MFWNRHPYEKRESEFLEAMKENFEFQFENCKPYRELLMQQGWTLEKIRAVTDVTQIPVLPTLFLKHHTMDAVPEKKIRVRATSSGTSGNKSRIGFDLTSLWRALGMSLSIGRYHKLFSLRRCHYIILGYEYRGKSASEEKAVAKTAHAFTYLAPAKSRTYALTYDAKIDDYTLNLDAVREALLRYKKGRRPVRIIGFPFHAYWLLSKMKEEGITCHLPKGSVMAFGGGWKQHYAERVDKETMYELLEEVLGIPGDRVWEFFGAVEHPILYTTCKNHHFHVPIYSEVCIRNVENREPLNKYGEIGLVNLMTPLVKSAPVLSIMTDDLGILHEGSSCGCGIPTPYLEILGRVGIEDITTCAAGAEQITNKRLLELMEEIEA